MSISFRVKNTAYYEKLKKGVVNNGVDRCDDFCNDRCPVCTVINDY